MRHPKHLTAQSHIVRFAGPPLRFRGILILRLSIVIVIDEVQGNNVYILVMLLEVPGSQVQGYTVYIKGLSGFEYDQDNCAF